MAKIQVNRIVNANIYIDGTNLLGRAEEVKLPDIQAIMNEHKALGMVGKIELPSGFDKLEGEVKWNSLYEESAKAMANPFKAVQRLLTNTLSNPNTGERFDLATGTKTVVAGLNAGAPKVGSLYGFTNRIWADALVTDKQPSADRHFLQVAGQPGSFAVRTTRCADNFLGGFASTPDAARFLTYAANSINWYDPATGQYKVVDLTGESPYKLRVRTYAPANDYANYFHLPYLPGLMCRMR